MNGSESQVDSLLTSLNQGDQNALADLISAVIERLRQIARSVKKGERWDNTWGTTDLIGELYIRLSTREKASWNDAAHFFASVTLMLRSLLIDRARFKQRKKREPERWAVSIDENLNVLTSIQDPSIMELDEAITALTRVHSRQAQIVQLKYFVGLTEDEMAAVLGVTSRTVRRDWQRARLWLLEHLDSDVPT